MLLGAGASAQTATVFKQTLEGEKGQLAKDSSVTLQDSIYFNPALQDRLELPYKVRNVVTFRINEHSPRYQAADYAADLQFRLIYTRPDHTIDSVDTNLQVNYDSAGVYTGRNYLVFENAHRLTVKILSYQSGMASAVQSLVLDVEMQVFPVYKLDCVDDAIRSITSNNPPNTDSTDAIQVTWPVVPGADEYDLEWAYIDSSALNRYGNPVNPKLVFRNNASRMTLSANSFKIPLLYDNGGKLFFRVRAVQQKSLLQRLETSWSSDFAGGMGAYSFCGHQRSLNWQSTISFAEAGKHKAVVQYSDGSLHGRQTVTKDNSKEMALVSENFLDYQGRPVIQVLPAPAVTPVIKYNRLFNTALDGSEYTKNRYDSIGNPSQFLSASAQPIGSQNGAGKYYSPQNPDKNTGFHQFIPDGQGYPFVEVSYTQDNTGRISRQSQPGPVHKLGSHHETKYYYAGAAQDELDALFGTEAGDEKHYFKNMVRDANGQYSVSYLDMKGRTIATALAGKPDSATMRDLPGYASFGRLDTLSGSSRTQFRDLVMENKKSQLVPVDGDYTFRYKIVAPVLTMKDSAGADVPFKALYELRITITDDAYNQLLGGQPFDTVIRNYDPQTFAAADLDFSFTKHLPKGQYEISKQLTISQAGMAYYRDSIFDRINRRTLVEEFIQQQKDLFIKTNCVPQCETCLASIGTWQFFRNEYMTKAGIVPADSAAARTEAETAYARALKHCEELCGKASEADNIRTAMLDDMAAPSGQYATLSDSLYKYSIFRRSSIGALAPYQFASVRYLDENGKEDQVYDEAAGQFVSPNILTPEQFADKFKSSWAESLLHLHPEYCKLLGYEKYKTSLEYDYDFEQTDTYAEAKAKGYLNPVGNPGYPYLVNNVDPLFILNPLVGGQAVKARMEGELQRFGTNFAYSIWSMAVMSVKCPKGDMSCVNTYNTAGNVFESTGLCIVDQDMAWRSFRALYLQKKKLLMQALVGNGDCPGVHIPSAGELMLDGKQSQFMSATDALANSGLAFLNGATESQGRDSATAAFSRLIDENCRSNAKRWMQQLAPCNYSAAALEQIILPRLIQVCKEGGDDQHIYGSSTVRPGSSYQYKSFEAVLEEYNRENGITDPLVCNEFMITFPKPYDKQLPVGNKAYLKPDECECEKLKHLETEFNRFKKVEDVNLSAYIRRTRNVSILQSDLDIIHGSCNNIVDGCSYLPAGVLIPAMIQCGTAPACVTCIQVNEGYAAFTSKYPGIVPTIGEDTATAKQDLFAAFMNARFGFSKQAWEYLAFIDSCQTIVSKDSVVCSEGTRSYMHVFNNNGTDMMKAIAAVGDSGFILAGYTSGCTNGGQDAYLIRTDRNGDLMWAKTYGGAGNDEFGHVVATSDGGFLASGTTRSYSGTNSGIFVVKVAANGEVTWSKNIAFGTAGELSGHAIELQKVTTNSRASSAVPAYALVGSYNYASGLADWFAGTLTAQGNVVWMEVLSSSYTDDAGVNVIEDGDALVVTGHTNAGPNAYNCAVLKLDKYNGNIINKGLFDVDNAVNWIGPIIKSPEGYKILIYNSNNYGGSNGRASILDITSNLVPIRARSLSTPSGSNPAATNVIAGHKGQFWFMHGANVSGAPEDLYLSKLTPDNSIISTNRLIVPGGQSPYRLVLGADGGVNVSGASNGKAMLVQLDSAGLTNCVDGSATVTGTLVNVTDRSAVFAISRNYLPMRGFDITVTARSCNPVETREGCAQENCFMISNSPMLCGNAEPVFKPVDVNEINNCSDSTFFAVSTGTELYKAYRDSLITTFDDKYLASAMEAPGRELFTLSYNTSEYHYTLYYYDQAGNLVKTVPPAGAVVDMSKAWTGQVQSARRSGGKKVPGHTLVTQYRYNSLGAVIWQQSPDGGISRFWYDRLGRLVVSQNAEQLDLNKFGYTKYDYLGRIAEVGEMTSTTAMTDLISRNDQALGQWLSDAAASRTQVAKTTYDVAAPMLNGLALKAGNLRNRVSWMATYPVAPDLTGLNYESAQFYSYDIHGNVDTLLQDYKVGVMAAAGNRFKRIAYNYDLVTGKVNRVSYQPGAVDQFMHRYLYDAENRLVNVETSQDGIYWENDAYYQYYKHGPLSRQVVGQQQVQGMDYAYTLQGWLKGVNSTTSSAEKDMGADGVSGGITAKDVFGFGLYYYGDRDYQPVGPGVNAFSSITPLGANMKPLFNGNIAAVSLAMPAIGEPLLNAYEYDVLNRIGGKKVFRNLDTVSNIWAPALLEDFREDFSYDANGNITRLKRAGNQRYAGNPLSMDSLFYHYMPGTNKLVRVEDHVPSGNYTDDIDTQPADNYRYDKIGNLTGDAGAGITRIDWTVYGKIARIIKNNQDTITYRYDVGGNRINKTVNGKTTWYVRDAQGNVMSVYSAGDAAVSGGELSRTEVHLYGSSRLGVYELATNVQSPAAVPEILMPGLGKGTFSGYLRGRKFFELSDHLGNVRATVSDKKFGVSQDNSTIAYYVPEVHSMSDYYAFGSGVPGRKLRLEKGYRYGFNGQEKSDEINGEGNSYTAEFWQYDARIGRRWNVDPISFPKFSPFSTFYNNPILFSDPNGDCPTCPKGASEGATHTWGGLSFTFLNGSWGHTLKGVEVSSVYTGNASSRFKGWINAVGAGGIRENADALYQKKLARYNDGFARAIYGVGSDGRVAVPQSIRDRLRGEANGESYSDLKSRWASDVSGWDPNSVLFNINPVAMAGYYSARAEAVTGKAEGYGIATEVGLNVGLSWVGRAPLSTSNIPVSGGLYRRGGNSGVFSALEVPMQMRYVKSVANQAGVGLHGIKIKIVRDGDLIGRNVFGFAHRKTITLYPDAFSNYETLVKTLGHERTHIFQFQLHGPPLSTEAGMLFEKAAWGIEDTFWEFYKANQ